VTGVQTCVFRSGYRASNTPSTFSAWPSSYFTVLTGGNVGIGTTSPSAKLEIAGFSTGAGLKLNYGNSSGTIEAVNFIANGGANGVIGMQMVSAGVGDLWLGGSGGRTLTLYRDGNVGIGTTSPNTLLSVSPGSSYAADPTIQVVTSYPDGYDAILSLNNTHTGGRNWFMRSTNDSQGDFGGGKLVFQDRTAGASTAVMTLVTGGNVGIGTTSPGYKLAVNGNTGLALDSGGIIVSSYDGNTGNIKPSVGNGSVLISDDSGTTGRGTEFLNNGGFTTATTVSRIATFLSNVADGLVYTNISATQQTTSGGTSPAAIELVGLRGTSTHGRHAWIGAEGVDGTTYRTQIKFKIRPEDSAYEWSTLPTQMVIDGNGNVGIGTTSPTHLLSLNRATEAAAYQLNINSAGGISDGNFTGIRFSQDSDASTELGNIKLHYYSNGATDLSFGTRYSPTAVYIRSSGNVGIGTTSPSGKLEVIGADTSFRNDVNGGTNTVYIRNWGSSANAALVFGTLNGDDSSTVLTHTSANTFDITNYGDPGSAIRFGTRNAGGISDIRMKIDQDGNVGIGTTSPSYNLQVSGSIAIENQGTTTIETTTFAGTLTTNTNIAFGPTGSFKAAFFDYYVASSSTNMRAGTVMAVHNNSTSRYTDTSTADIGNTAAVDFTTSVVGGNLVLTANISSGTWEIKTAYRAL
jgi:hypothetical protein